MKIPGTTCYILCRTSMAIQPPYAVLFFFSYFSLRSVDSRSPAHEIAAKKELPTSKQARSSIVPFVKSVRKLDVNVNSRLSKACQRAYCVLGRRDLFNQTVLKRSRSLTLGCLPFPVSFRLRYLPACAIFWTVSYTSFRKSKLLLRI